MESNLFIELAEEQQEMVAGGIDFTITASNFSGKSSGLTSKSTSTAAGTTAESTGFDTRVFNAGSSLTAFVAPAIVVPGVPVVTFV